MNAKDQVWKIEALGKRYLEGVRGAIPMAKEQIELICYFKVFELALFGGIKSPLAATGTLNTLAGIGLMTGVYVISKRI